MAAENHVPETPLDRWLWQRWASEDQPCRSCRWWVRKNCVVCSAFSISLGETTTGVWKHLSSAQPIWLPLFPPGLCSLAVSTACIWAPSCLCSGANQLVSPKEKPRHDWQCFFSRVAQTEEPVMSWTRLCPGQFSNHPGRLHAHRPPCCAAEPKTPSRPAAKTSCWQEATQSFNCLENLKIKAIIDPGPVGLYRELRGDPGQVLHSMKVASALQRVLVLSVVVTSQPVAMSNELMVPPRHFPQWQQTRSLCQVANTAFPFFSLRLFLDFANYFFPVAQCSGSKALGTLWSCRSGWRRSGWCSRSVRTGLQRQNEDTKHWEPRTREATSLCRSKKNMVTLLEGNSTEMNPNPTPFWKESPKACKKSGNLR